jgi:hypothetical protein
VRLGSRAFDILTALVEHAGEVVGKEELIARAWPRTFVEEANLKIQVSALRRALGVISGHMQCKKGCLLYPQKRTLAPLIRPPRQRVRARTTAR